MHEIAPLKAVKGTHPGLRPALPVPHVLPPHRVVKRPFAPQIGLFKAGVPSWRLFIAPRRSGVRVPLAPFPRTQAPLIEPRPAIPLREPRSSVRA